MAQSRQKREHRAAIAAEADRDRRRRRHRHAGGDEPAAPWRRRPRGRGRSSPGPSLGSGWPTGTRDPWHRLNVPALRAMSAFPDDPDHFRRWMGTCRGAVLRVASTTGAIFRRRSRTPSPRPGRCSDTRARPSSGWSRTATGSRSGSRPATAVTADALVLATGLELPPRARLPATRWSATRGSCVDPWVAGALDAVARRGRRRRDRQQPDGDRRHGLDPQRASRGRRSSRCRDTATCRGTTRTRGDPASRNRRSPWRSSWRSTRRSTRRSSASARSETTGRGPSTRCGRSPRRCGWRWTTT